MSAPNGSVGSHSGGWNCWPPQTGGCGQGVQGGCATYHQGLKTGVCQGCGGGGGAAAHITASTGRRGASKGAIGDAAGGGGGRMGQTPWRHPRGGCDGTNTPAASPGGGGGANTLTAPPRGGGWDKHSGATPLPQPDEECESCRGKGGGRLGTTIKGKQVGLIAKRSEKR